MEYTTIGGLALAQIGRHPTFNTGSVESLIGTTEPLLIPGFSFRRYRAATVPADAVGAGDGADGSGEGVPRLFRLVVAGALGSFDIREERLGRVALELKPRMAGRVERHLLHEGDVVVSLEPPFRVAVASEGCAGALAGEGFAIIRMDDEAAREIDRGFLALWLSSTQVRALLEGRLDARAGGGAVRSLDVSDLFDVPVPLAPAEVQRALARLFASARERESSYWETEGLAVRLGDLACASVAGDVDGDLDTVDGSEALQRLWAESVNARARVREVSGEGRADVERIDAGRADMELDAGLDGAERASVGAMLDAVDELIEYLDGMARAETAAALGAGRGTTDGAGASGGMAETAMAAARAAADAEVMGPVAADGATGLTGSVEPMATAESAVAMAAQPAGATVEPVADGSVADGGSGGASRDAGAFGDVGDGLDDEPDDDLDDGTDDDEAYRADEGWGDGYGGAYGDGQTRYEEGYLSGPAGGEFAFAGVGSGAGASSGVGPGVGAGLGVDAGLAAMVPRSPPIELGFGTFGHALD